MENYWYDRYWPMYVGPESPLQSLAPLMHRISQARCIAVDCETAASEEDMDSDDEEKSTALDLKSAKLVGVSLTWREDTPPPELGTDSPLAPPNQTGPWYPSVYIPIGHHIYRNVGQSTLDFLKTILEDPKKVKITHNGFTFDGPIFHYRMGWTMCSPWFDTTLMAGMWDETKPRKLKVLGKGLLGFPTMSLDAMNKIPFDAIPPIVGYRYACQDSHLTYGLMEYFANAFKANYPEALDLLTKTEFPMSELFCRMSYQGMMINWSLLRRYQAACREVIDKCTAKARELLGRDVNLNSHAQVRSAFSALGISLPNAQAETLAKVNHPAARFITLSNKFSIYLSRYVDGTAKHAWKDGMARPTFVLWEVPAKGKKAGTECVTGDTMVWTSTGLVPIQTMFHPDHPQACFKEVDLTLPTVGDKGDVREGRATHTYLGGVRECLTVTTGLGLRITVTPEHPLLSSHGWVKAEDLTEGTLLNIPLSFRGEETDWDVEVDLSPPPRAKGDYSRIEPKRWPRHLTPGLARLLGYYQADGSYHDSNKSRALRITNSDEAVLRDIIDIIDEEFGIQVGIVRTKNRSPYVATPSAITDALVREFGLLAGAESKGVPYKVMGGPPTVVRNYLRGLLLDSTLPKDRPRVRIATANRETASWVQSLLLGLGYTCSRRVAHDRVTGHREQHLLLLEGVEALEFLRWASPISTKHRVYLDKWEGWQPKFRNPRYTKQGTMLQVPVTKVEPAGAHRVYDLHVPGSHSFISNGMVSHNTGRASARNPLVHQFPKEPVRFPVQDLDLSEGVHQLVEKVWNHAEDKWEYVPALNCRALLGAPEGHLLVATDLSQIEPRVSTAVTGEPLWLDGYNRGVGIYKPSGARVFRKSEDEVHKKSQEYKAAKVYILTKNYMGGAETVHRQCQHFGLNVTLEQVKEDLMRLAQELPLITAYPNTHVMPQLLENGYVRTIFGRRRHFPMYHPRDHKMLRQATNFTIQGASYDIMKRGMLRIDKRVRENNLQSRLCLNVHDEAVTIGPAAEALAVASILEEELTRDIAEFPHRVPLEAETEVGRWYGRMVSLSTYKDMVKMNGGPVSDPYQYEPVYNELKKKRTEQNATAAPPPQVPLNSSKLEAYKGLVKDVLPCRECSYGQFEELGWRKCGPLGRITEEVDVLWLVGHPEPEDLTVQRLLTGREGSFIRQEAYHAGLPIPPNGSALVAPAMWCAASESKGITVGQINCCRKYLDRLLDIANPRVIIALGSLSMRSILRCREMGLEDRLGWHELPDGTLVMVTYAPRFVLMSPGYTVPLRGHLQEVRKALREGRPTVPKRDELSRLAE